MHAQCVLIYGVAMIILQITLKIAKIFCPMVVFLRWLFNFMVKSMSHVTLSDKD